MPHTGRDTPAAPAETAAQVEMSCWITSPASRPGHKTIALVLPIRRLRAGPGAGILTRSSYRRTAIPPLLIVLCLFGCTESTEQPLAFNHKAHKEADIDCSVCHEYFEKEEYSGIPSTETCALCHGEDAQAPELRRLARYVSAGEEIPWKRLYAVPSHVYYSHRRHVVSGKIACAECHGVIGELAEPPKYALVNQSMQWCIDCHEARGASTDCIHCHR